MSNQKEGTRNRRSYPPFWEKFVPLAVGFIVLLIIILIVIAISVAIGLFPVQ